MDANTTVVNAASTPANEAPANAAPAADGTLQANETPANEAPLAANAANETTETRAEKRIKQLVAKQKDAETDAAYWRGVAEGRNATPGAAPAPAGDTPPTPEQFDSYDDYLYADFKHRMKREQAQETVVKTQAEAHQRFMEKVNQEAESEPEILEIMNDRTFLPLNNPMSTMIANAIKETEIPTQVMRHLHTNRADLQRLYNMNPFAAAREIGKIEQRLINLNKPEPVRKVSQAPEPLKTLQPQGSQNVDIEKISIEDFVKKRNAEQFGHQRR